METKICTKCGEEKDVSEFCLPKTKGLRNRYKKGICKKCKNIQKKEYLRLHPGLAKQYSHRYYMNKGKDVMEIYRNKNKEKRKQQQHLARLKRKELPEYKEKNRIRQLKYTQNNREKVIEINKKSKIKHRIKRIAELKAMCESANDNYIATVLQMPVKTIRQYPELIESKRVEIKLKRLIKTKKNENNETR
jgi:hypothetical protein